MNEQARLTERFEADRTHLRAVAYRMLGSVSEADDAVQEAWMRLNRSDVSAVENLTGWLTTVVARVSLDMLRSRRARREEPMTALPEPIVTREQGSDPEHEALVADSVGLALLVVLETLTPAERLAFVLHDMFAIPFDEIGLLVGRSPAAARQLASRARRRVRGAAPAPNPDVAVQQRIVDAFLAAAREADFDALVAVLDPDVVLRVHRVPVGIARELRGAATVAEQLRTGARFAADARPALVNGAAGVVVVRRGRTIAVVGFTVADDRIAAIDVLSGAAQLRDLDLTSLDTG